MATNLGSIHSQTALGRGLEQPERQQPFGHQAHTLISLAYRDANVGVLMS